MTAATRSRRALRLCSTALLATAVGLTVAACAGGENREVADLVLRGGQVITMEPDSPTAEAIAVRDGQILVVGGNADVAKLIGPKTRVIELNGRAVLPGFIDTHIHSAEGSLAFGKCTLDDVATTSASVAARIRECDKADRANNPQPGRWLEILGVNPSGLILTAADLDRIVADRPVVLRGSDYHTAWVNSRALAEAKIGAKTPDPEGGVIERDREGQATGFLKDPPAIQLALRAIPKPSIEERLKLLAQAQAMHASHGITTIMEPKATADDLELYVLQASRGLPPLNVHAALVSDIKDAPETYDRLASLRTRFNGKSPRLVIDGVKVLPDGAIEHPTQTAAMLEPYRDAAGHQTTNFGKRYFDPAEFARFVTRIEKMGLRLHAHAIGDYTTRATLDAIAAARAANGAGDRRHAITHLQAVSPADIPRFRDLGVIANMQLLWAIADDYTVKGVKPFVDPTVFRYMYPARSLVDGGAVLVGSSDWPVSTDDPLAAMRHALTRRSSTTAPVLEPAERVDLPTILAAYTRRAAFALGEEQRLGTLKPRKIADITILSRSLRLPQDNLDNVMVDMTVSHGAVSYRRTASAE